MGLQSRTRRASCRALRLSSHDVNFRRSSSVVTSCTIAAGRRLQVGRRSAWSGRIGYLAIGTEAACAPSESCLCAARGIVRLSLEKLVWPAESSANGLTVFESPLASSGVASVMVEEVGGR
jgi:hypothetical protein